MATLYTAETAALENRLRAIIRETGISVTRLASLTGIPRSSLARYVREGGWSVADLVAVCRVLDVAPASLLDGGPAETAALAARLAASMRPLSVAEVSAIRALIESAVELRTAAVEDALRITGRK